MGSQQCGTDEIRSAPPANRRNLIAPVDGKLRDLEEKGFIYRHYEPTIPPAVTYGLTKRMQEISGALDKLDELAHKWQEEDAKGVRKRKAKAV